MPLLSYCAIIGQKLSGTTRETRLLRHKVRNAKYEGSCGAAISLTVVLCLDERQQQRERGRATASVTNLLQTLHSHWSHCSGAVDASWKDIGQNLLLQTNRLKAEWPDTKDK
ncbi:hypothetical protein BU25DRAFT_412683 [Macroventuria anomochaeta]|uniref:Uncharacterized protein n=1 Tax=Macroventuria anomochaeta TaxID=301207 RepID=A0ACB6RTX9_9PLEO|nr:uncharacterized protein BU25DRAFT_412683 [Macroventuria anomochaeta]KAF2625234.1 hypothetical protein BU25DRAFT_412683 [Macroventuria anomochaeta]